MSVQMNIERQPVIQRGNLTIDPQCYTVTLAGEEIDLYPKEFDVLHLLMQYPGWVLSSEQIYKAVWQEDTIGSLCIAYQFCFSHYSYFLGISILKDVQSCFFECNLTINRYANIIKVNTCIADGRDIEWMKPARK